MAPISDIERQVYTDIYQTYSGKLYGVCLHYVNDRETAEDLLHEVNRYFDNGSPIETVRTERPLTLTLPIGIRFSL